MDDVSMDELVEFLASVLRAKDTPFNPAALRVFIERSMDDVVALGFVEARTIVSFLELPFRVRQHHGDAGEFLQLAIGAVMAHHERSPEQRFDFIEKRLLDRPQGPVDESALLLLKLASEAP